MTSPCKRLGNHKWRPVSVEAVRAMGDDKHGIFLCARCNEVKSMPVKPRPKFVSSRLRQLAFDFEEAGGTPAVGPSHDDPLTKILT